MLLVLDANVIVADPMLRSAIWPQLADAVRGGRVEVLLPTLALEEAIATYRRLREAKAVEIQAVGRKASRDVQAHLERARKAALREGRKYPKRIRTALEAVGVSMIDAPRVTHSDVARRAIARRRPFDENGSGYRDTLHWLSVLEVVDGRFEDEDIVFVSADRRAFGGEGNARGELHQHLVDDLAERGAEDPWFRWIQSLAEFSVPGVFHDQIQEGFDIAVSAGEIGGYLQSALWESRLDDLLPRDLGTPGEPAALFITDIGEPLVGEVEVRQYWERGDLRADFLATVDVELALQRVRSGGGDVEVQEDRVVLPFVTSGHVDITASRDGLMFSSLELGPFALVETE
ncbi:PIN domain-containing protein [Microbacterium sp. Yaish 1]|uniref:PIN domain-containing protein n=1 Tax=Microbacterium sp. Yaish 1 TaxID=2025014 RepID=UPI000B9416C9|nr:PIN domain-containing protein [Microbacterium sp. Yaish 1]OYC97154.1 hypothetical protein CI089_00935 [Microbacterium sp. Yaish 1]